MAKVRFGERSRNYVQEVDMQDLVIKCDVCLKQIGIKKEGRQLVASLNSGLRRDGVCPVNFNWKDICDECSFKLVSLLRNLTMSKNE